MTSVAKDKEGISLLAHVLLSGVSANASRDLVQLCNHKLTYQSGCVRGSEGNNIKWNLNVALVLTFSSRRSFT